ncbi:MAG: Rne/Rng family ribonuclease [Candidatus Kapabacteria bacterium]|nr:Rne/Rng family ribonuclease [Candidatus Kapabacteria bacterium]
MKKDIIINSTMNEVRIAILEDDQLAEFLVEMPDKERSIGNIYLGKVSRIVPGINAAFINIGKNQDAFLHFSDIDETLENIITEDEDDDFDDEDNFNSDVYDSQHNKADSSLKIIEKPKRKTVADIISSNKAKKSSAKQISTAQNKRSSGYKINLEEGQNVLVQVIREAYGSKGVRVTTRIGLPGKYTVLLPFDSIIGVSKKIYSRQERKRLRNLAKHSLPQNFGCIIRTASEGKSDKELLKDWESLLKTWEEIEKKVKHATEPGLVYQDMELATSVIRDLFTDDVQRVVVDSKKLYKDILSYVKWSAPQMTDRIELYTDKVSIFDKFGIERELEQTYKRKLNLPSGGSIVIDKTEAMFVIDVNTGKSVSEKVQEQNAYKTNLEAVKEIARQIRLRDMSGMILIDFIDMAGEVHRKKLYLAMKKALKRDRAKIVVYPLTKLGIMQITRQRINQYIQEKLTENCPVCNGRGKIASRAVLLSSIERWLKNFRSKSREFRLILEVHPYVADYLTEGTLSKLSKLMIKFFVKIKLQQNDLLPIDHFKFYSQRRNVDITNEFIHLNSGNH